jgi:hypothetical protein
MHDIVSEISKFIPKVLALNADGCVEKKAKQHRGEIYIYSSVVTQVEKSQLRTLRK